MQKAAVVTGVSTGIGNAITMRLVGAGYHVFGSVRRAEDAVRLSESLGKNFTPLLFDICDESAARAAADKVRDALAGNRLSALVNNAGVALGAPILHQPIAQVRQQFEINVIGQVIVTQAFAPLLGTDRTLRGAPGRIVMMSSDSGEIGAPFVGAYVASKHAVEGLASCMRRELQLVGIDVIVIGPGFVATPIWDKAQKAEHDEFAAYRDTVFASAIKRFTEYMQKNGRNGFPPDRIAKAVENALTSSKPAARYPVVKGWLENWFLPRKLPARMVDRIMAKQFGLLPEQS